VATGTAIWSRPRSLRRKAESEYEEYIRVREHLTDAMEDRKARARNVRKAPARMGISEARLHRRSATEKQEKLNSAVKAMQTRLEKLKPKEKPQPLPKVKFLALPQEEGMTSRYALQVQNLRFGYTPELEILRGVNLFVPTGARVALTGKNGAGKSTLLACIRDGAPGVRLPPSARIGFFSQDLTGIPEAVSLIDYVSEEASLDRSLVRWVLVRLGLDTQDWNKPLGVLSGGERCRAQLARLLTAQYPILILDEPTNYLDFNALEGLEEMLVEFGGTVLYVSHDRYFRRQTATLTVELRDGLVVQQTESPRQPPRDLALEWEYDRLMSLPDNAPALEKQQAERRLEELRALGIGHGRI